MAPVKPLSGLIGLKRESELPDPEAKRAKTEDATAKQKANAKGPNI